MLWYVEYEKQGKYGCREWHPYFYACRYLRKIIKEEQGQKIPEKISVLPKGYFRRGYLEIEISGFDSGRKILYKIKKEDVFCV